MLCNSSYSCCYRYNCHLVLSWSLFVVAVVLSCSKGQSFAGHASKQLTRAKLKHVDGPEFLASTDTLETIERVESSCVSSLEAKVARASGTLGGELGALEHRRMGLCRSQVVVVGVFLMACHNRRTNTLPWWRCSHRFIYFFQETDHKQYGLRGFSRQMIKKATPTTPALVPQQTRPKIQGKLWTCAHWNGLRQPPMTILPDVIIVIVVAICRLLLSLLFVALETTMPMLVTFAGRLLVLFKCVRSFLDETN